MPSPKTHRHLVGQVRELASDLRELPNGGTDDYEQARGLMSDRLALVMKHAMRADIFTRRGDRDAAAVEWWGFRRALRSATALYGCARIFNEVGS